LLAPLLDIPLPSEGLSHGRTSDWVKKTDAQRETLTIAGFALDGKKWDGIYVGRRKRAYLCRQGRSWIRQGLGRRPAERSKPPIRKKPTVCQRIAHKGIWVEPKLLTEIENRAKSLEGKVRHPFFRTRGRIFEGRFDRFWQWAEKPLQPNHPPDLHMGAGSGGPKGSQKGQRIGGEYPVTGVIGPYGFVVQEPVSFLGGSES
jgi:hypothetical protein